VWCSVSLSSCGAPLRGVFADARLVLRMACRTAQLSALEPMARYMRRTIARRSWRDAQTNQRVGWTAMAGAVLSTSRGPIAPPRVVMVWGGSRAWVNLTHTNSMDARRMSRAALVVGASRSRHAQARTGHALSQRGRIRMTMVLTTAGRPPPIHQQSW